MTRIGIYSIPFGFGPTGKAITLANSLKKNYKVTLISYKHSKHILEKETGVNIIDCKSRNFKLWDPKIFNDVDILISIMDLRLVDYVAQNYPQIKIIFFDSLFWWRNELTSFQLKNIEAFIIQYFPGVKKSLKIVPKQYLSKFHIIRPLTPSYSFTNNNERLSEKVIILHFGGISSLLISWREYSEYLGFLTSLVSEYFKDTDFDIVITGNNDAMNFLRNRFDSSEALQFKCLKHSHFVELLNSAYLFLTTCGIEATYEAYNNRIPTIFLPPLNSTQLHQTLVLKKEGFPIAISCEINARYKNIIMKKLSYKEETVSLALSMKQIINNPKEARVLKENLIRLIAQYSDKLKRKDLIKKQTQFKSRINTDGVAITEKIIAKMMNIDEV